MSEVEGQDIQEQVEPEVIADERPAWLPQNFKSPEDLARSYQYAQGELTQTKQQLSVLQQQVQELAEAREHTRAAEQYSTIEEQLAEAIESGDPRQQLATMAWLAKEAARAELSQYQPAQAAPDTEVIAMAVNQKMREKYDDWDDLRGDIGQVVQDNPGLLPIGDTPSVSDLTRGLDAVYRIAKANRVLSSADSIRAVESEASRLAKNAAQTITGASQRPATMTPEQELWESIKSAETNSIRLGRI